MDDGSERIQAKVKVAADMKVPYLAVVGPRDAENREVSIRAFGIDRNLGSMGLEEFLETVSTESRTRGETRLIDRFEEVEAG
jgi:threonyl-tRNA synthetase